MRGSLTIIHPTGFSTTVPLNAPPSQDTLRRAVGGWLQIVPLFDLYEGERCIAYCDEEGKLKGSIINPAATRLWYKQVPQMINQDVLVGDIVIVRGDREFMSRL